jgi:hypothetical protein
MEGNYEGKEGEGEKLREKIIVANRATEAWNTNMQLVLTVITVPYQNNLTSSSHRHARNACHIGSHTSVNFTQHLDPVP